MHHFLLFQQSLHVVQRLENMKMMKDIIIGVIEGSLSAVEQSLVFKVKVGI